MYAFFLTYILFFSIIILDFLCSFPLSLLQAVFLSSTVDYSSVCCWLAGSLPALPLLCPGFHVLAGCGVWCISISMLPLSHSMCGLLVLQELPLDVFWGGKVAKAFTTLGVLDFSASACRPHPPVQVFSTAHCCLTQWGAILEVWVDFSIQREAQNFLSKREIERLGVSQPWCFSILFCCYSAS